MPKLGFVYFISDGECIKVGFTTDVDKRMSALQGANSRSLSLVAVMPGSFDDEGKLHEELKQHCVIGEWFNRDEVMAVLSKLAKRRRVHWDEAGKNCRPPRGFNDQWFARLMARHERKICHQRSD